MPKNLKQKAMDERKGFLTPEQEKTLEKLVKLNNPLLEKFDGIAIQIIDNQGLERAKAKITEKYPDALPLVYDVVDGLFEALAEIVKEEV